MAPLLELETEVYLFVLWQQCREEYVSRQSKERIQDPLPVLRKTMSLFPQISVGSGHFSNTGKDTMRKPVYFASIVGVSWERQINQRGPQEIYYKNMTIIHNLFFWGTNHHILTLKRDVFSAGHSQAFWFLQDLSASNSFISCWDETGLLQVSFNGDLDAELLHSPWGIRCKQIANRFIGIYSFHCLL